MAVAVQVEGQSNSPKCTFHFFDMKQSESDMERNQEGWWVRNVWCLTCGCDHAANMQSALFYLKSQAKPKDGSRPRLFFYIWHY